MSLRDGTRVIVRPIAPDDKALLRDAFERLSPDSRYRRFFRPLSDLSTEELRFFTEVDHHDHEALIATDPDGARALGVARFVRDPRDGDRAEAAVAVVDECQGRGLGRVLLERLADRARHERVRNFTALVQGDNRRALTVLKELGSTQTKHFGSDVELDIALPSEGGIGTQLAEALRAAASQVVTMRLVAQRAAGSMLKGGVSDYEMSDAIVVGTDGSDTAQLAVRRAAEIARALGSPLHLVTAIASERAHRPPPADAEASSGDVGDSPVESGNAGAFLDQAAEGLQRDGIDVSTHVRTEGPADAIIGVAEEVRARMIVVGSRGMTGVSRFMLGSVPNKVSHHAPCDVLIVRTTGG
jgi:nucleotide-binding universal stress UspA family protein/GNAT superfamily N-acetyltransferase